MGAKYAKIPGHPPSGAADIRSVQQVISAHGKNGDTIVASIGDEEVLHIFGPLDGGTDIGAGKAVRQGGERLPVPVT